MEEHKKRSGKTRVFHDIDDKIDLVSKSRTKKMTVDFCAEETATIKSFAMKEKQEMLETFCFPDEIVKKIYDKKVYVYTS